MCSNRLHLRAARPYVSTTSGMKAVMCAPLQGATLVVLGLLGDEDGVAAVASAVGCL
jgi:hypothetical protein